MNLWWFKLVVQYRHLFTMKAPTLTTLSRVTASTAWRTVSGGWYAAVVRAWVPISSNRISELSIDIRYSVFTWFLCKEDKPRWESRTQLHLHVQIYSVNSLCSGDVSLWYIPLSHTSHLSNSSFDYLHRGRQQAQVQWNVDSGILLHIWVAAAWVNKPITSPAESACVMV